MTAIKVRNGQDLLMAFALMAIAGGILVMVADTAANLYASGFPELAQAALALGGLATATALMGIVAFISSRQSTKGNTVQEGERE